MLRVICLTLCVLGSPVQAADRLLVFAAASQRDVLAEIGDLFEETCSCEVKFSFAATSTLARQIDAGAKADVFISANEAWVDWLDERGALADNSQTVIAGNRLVIASSTKTKDSFNILLRGRFAMADPRSVPSGIYGRQALTTMGIWKSAQANAVYSENVRVALAQIKRGDLLSGIIYQSDLQFTDELHVHYVFPASTHQPIHYVAAKTSGNDLGSDFIELLKSDRAQQIFLRFGFLSLSATNQE